MKHMHFVRGFTIMELLVVIAIIGILASVVLVSVTTARGGANDAKVKEQLISLRTQADIVYTRYSSKYGSADPATVDCPATANSLTGDATVANLLSTMPTNTLKKCAVSGTQSAYAVAAQLSATGTTGDYWCVDSTGSSKLINITAIGTVALGDSTCTAMDAR